MQAIISDSKTGKSSRRSPKGERTRAAILDAAEEMFASAAYDTVFQRDIAARADVLIGVLTHHYPSKLSLFDAVVGRRAAELNEVRLHRLHALHKPSAEEVLDAFFEPFIERASGVDAGWLAYFRMMQKFVFTGEGVEIHSRYYKDVVLEFAVALGKACPETKPAEVQLSFSCAIDLVLTGAFQPARFDAVFSNGKRLGASESATVKKRYALIRTFIQGGFKAIAG